MKCCHLLHMIKKRKSVVAHTHAQNFFLNVLYCKLCFKNNLLLKYSMFSLQQILITEITHFSKKNK